MFHSFQSIPHGGPPPQIYHHTSQPIK